MQDAQPLLVRLEGDRLPVGGEGEAVHVPGDVRGQVGVPPRGEIEVGEALELGLAVGGDVDPLAVGAPPGARVGDLLGAALRGRQRLRSRRHVHHPDVALVHGDPLDHEELRVVRRPVGRAPAAARHLEDASRRGRVLRVHDVDVAVGAVAPRRAEGHPVAGVRPGAEGVLRAAAVRDHGDGAGGDVEAEDLAELVAAAVLLEEQVVGRAAGPARAAHAVGEEGELPACAARHLHLVDLGRVAEARGDEHLALHRVPPGEARGAELGVAAHRLGDVGRDLRDPVGHEVVRGPDDGRLRGGRRRGGLGQEGQNAQGEERAHRVTFRERTSRALARARRRPWSGESASTSSQGTQRISCSSARSGATVAPSGATTR